VTRGAIFLLIAALPALAQNLPERLEWFRDQGFGLFIHWSVDSQLGAVISHSMVGASDDYLERYLNDLPETFNPRKFAPRDWAVLAKLAGVKYVVFTAKHHNGFAMYDSAVTPFGVMHTPFARDVAGEILKEFREIGIAPGLYFSPDDFYWLHNNRKLIDRHRPEVEPANNPGLMKYDQAQVRELLTKYGAIDIMFFDGPPEGLRELAWELQPNIVVTRGAIETPEQYIPGVPIDAPWEACLTMGTQWHYKPTNEQYKSGGELIQMLIETRAKGGNLLLNVGPKPDGELPIEQEERLREIALWMFVNSEAIYGVRPWVITNEGDVWFTKKKNENTVYAIVKQKPVWKLGEWRDITLRSVAAGPDTEITVLGQNDRVLEYRSDVVPKTTWKLIPGGLVIRAMRAQRLYNDRRWPNPVVLKISNAKPAMQAPRVETSRAVTSPGGTTFEGAVRDLGNAGTVEAGFQWRPAKGITDLYEKTEPWRDTPTVKVSRTGTYSVAAPKLTAGEYEFRAVIKHPLVTIYGADQKVLVK
jgi:alpha-L-fucosidase